MDALATVVEAPLSTPFPKETILVPSRALAAWLSTELAKRHGVWANPDFPTPRAWIHALTSPTALTATASGAADPFQPEALTWSIAAALPAHLEDAAFADVRRYLEDDTDGTKRLALAERIARVFDRYVLHRPDLVASWTTARDGDHWQAKLFRALVAKHGETHLAARVDRRVADLKSGARREGLPERLSVFCIGPQPRVVQRALAALADVIPVYTFELELALEPGHAVAPEHTVLAHVQHGWSIEAAAAPTQTRRALDPADRSVSVHACHSATRECEVLRDQLLAALQADPTLEPRDIRVLCPDIESYAVAIDAVFGVDPKDPLHLPYRIADRPAGAALPVVEALFALIDVASSRMAAPAVLDLLYREPIRVRFGLSEPDIETIRGWIVDAGIRWAADAEHRAEVGQPAHRQNTWAFGIDRLLLGYAMGADGDATYEGVLPTDDIDGSAGKVLGALASFSEKLFELRRELLGRATLDVWRRRLAGALETFLASGRTLEFQHQIVRTALDAVVARAAAAGFAEEVPLAVVRDALAADLGERGGGFDLGVGAVTFARLAPGRCVPARVVALLGMNDGVFPRAPRPLGFDLLAEAPEAGDPSPRDEDRRVFQEALLAARQQLVVTYVGRSIKNDAERPPSVVVSEMLDAIDAVFTWSGTANTAKAKADADAAKSSRPKVAATQPNGTSVPGTKPASEHIVVPHALHAFSPRYFRADGDDRLFSHAIAAAEAAKAMAASRQPAPPFVGAPVPPPPGEEERRPITIDELCAFFAHPVEAFVMRRAGVYLPRDVPALADREPFVLAPGLERWSVQTPLVARARAGEDLTAIPPALAASGKLPLGTVGGVLYEELHPGPGEMGRLVRDLLGPTAPPALEIDLALAGLDGGVRLVGWLRSVGAKAQVLHRYSVARGKHEIAAWIRHLAMLAAGVRRDTMMISKGPFGPVVHRFSKVARPHVYLADLVALYRLGQRMPLPLFPDPASDYCAKLAEGKTADEALDAARKSYGAGYDGAPNNDYVVKLYGERDPLAPSFRLFAPEAFTDVDVAGRAPSKRDGAGAAVAGKAPSKRDGAGASVAAESTADALAGAPPSFADLATRVFGPLRAHLEPVDRVKEAS